MIEDGRTGWLVPPGDPNALSRMLTEVLSNSALVEKGRESMRKAEEFDFDTVADKQIELYRKILG